MKSVIYFHDVQHLSQMCCHFISSIVFSYNVALNIWTQTSTTCSSRETSCVIWCFYIFINTSYLYSKCALSDHWPGHQIQCISSKLRLGRYLRNVSSMGVGICLLKVDNSATTMCAKTFIAHITVTAPVPNVLAADIFGTGIFNDIYCHKTDTSLRSCTSLLLPPFPTSSLRKLYFTRTRGYLEWQCSIFHQRVPGSSGTGPINRPRHPSTSFRIHYWLTFGFSLCIITVNHFY